MMYILREISRAIRVTFIFWILTAMIYPLFILMVGQMPLLQTKATGSIIQDLGGQPIGSVLIGQSFTAEEYFHSRPSAIEYSEEEKGQPTGISGASNLAPSNPQLLDRITEEVNELTEAEIPFLSDLIYTSGSGLDPHISLESARNQLNRVASARGLQPDDIYRFIGEYTEGRFLGIFGEPSVNVLRLNYALYLEDFNRRRN